MSDTYLRLVNSGVTAKIAKQLGLPRPSPLQRYTPGQPLVDGPVLVLGTGKDTDAIAGLLAAPAADFGWDLDVHRHATPDDTLVGRRAGAQRGRAPRRPDRTRARGRVRAAQPEAAARAS